MARTVTTPRSARRTRITSPSAVASCSSPPGMPNGVAVPSPNSAAPATVTETSRSTASSQVSGAPGPGQVLRCTWRNLTTTSTDGSPSRVKTHSARAVVVSDGSAAAYAGGISTPNCQRLRFFWDEARYG